MTELEWLVCKSARALVTDLRLPDPPAVSTADSELRFLAPEDERWKISTRQRRLIGTACCERIERLLPPGARNVLEASWQLADRAIKVSEFEVIQLPVGVRHNPFTRLFRSACAEYAEQAMAYLFDSWLPLEDLLEYAQRALMAETSESAAREEEAVQARIVRCVVRNPFVPVRFDRAWATDTATILAQQMYDSREFGAMPVLADALQDAGCENDDILAHCRDPHAAHVRGCWVCDLVLARG